MSYEIEDAHPVRNEGTVIVFEGILLPDDERPNDQIEVVWFGVDHRMAQGVAEASEEGYAVEVEDWQILGRTVSTS